MAFKAGFREVPVCGHGITQVSDACCCRFAGLDGDAQDTGAGVVELHDGECHLQVTDLEIPGRGFSWRFERHYRSGIEFDGPRGHNWEFGYNRRLVVAADGSVTRMDGCGRADHYSHGTDGFDAPCGFYTRLVRNADGTFVEQDRTRARALYAAPDAQGVVRLVERPPWATPAGRARLCVGRKEVRT